MPSGAAYRSLHNAVSYHAWVGHCQQRHTKDRISPQLIHSQLPVFVAFAILARLGVHQLINNRQYLIKEMNLRWQIGSHNVVVRLHSPWMIIIIGCLFKYNLIM